MPSARPAPEGQCPARTHCNAWFASRDPGLPAQALVRRDCHLLSSEPTTIGCRRIRAQHGGISRPLFPAVPLTTNLQPLHLSTSTWQRCPHAGWVRVVMAGGGVHSVHPADVVLAASRAVANLLLQSAVGDAVCQGQAQLRYRVCALCSHGNGHAHRQQQQEHPHAATMRGDDAVRASSDGWYGTSSSQRPVLLAALPCLLGHGVTLVRLWQQGLLLAQAQ